MVEYLKKKLFATNSSSSGGIGGSYTDWVYDIADFSATGGTITPQPDEYVNRYKVIGKTLFWEFNLQCALSSTPTNIIITLPNGYSAKNSNNFYSVYIEAEGLTVTNLQATEIYIYKADITDFANNASTTIGFNLSFEIE